MCSHPAASGARRTHSNSCEKKPARTFLNARPPPWNSCNALALACVRKAWGLCLTDCHRPGAAVSWEPFAMSVHPAEDNDRIQRPRSKSRTGYVVAGLVCLIFMALAGLAAGILVTFHWP